MWKNLKTSLAVLVAAGLILLGLAGIVLSTQGSITVLDSTGATKTYQITVNGSGYYLYNNVICDYSAGANCAGVDSSHRLAIAAASGAFASGSIASGAMVDLGAQADAAAAADNSTASLIALLKRNNQNLTTLNTTAGSAIPAGTNLIGGVKLIDTGGTNAATVKAASTPAAATDTAVVVDQRPGTNIPVSRDGTANSATHGLYSNLLQGDAVISATNGLYNNLLQGNAVISATNGLYANQLQGNAVLSASNPTFTQPVAGTAGGASSYYVQPTASDNHVNIKNGAGTAYSVHASNNSATKNYLRLYDAGSAFNGCGSATGLIFGFEIPPTDSGFSILLGGSVGLAFTTGLSICVTSGYGSSDTTNATATAMMVNVLYK